MNPTDPDDTTLSEALVGLALVLALVMLGIAYC